MFSHLFVGLFAAAAMLWGGLFYIEEKQPQFGLSTFITAQGGTGTSSPSGILYGSGSSNPLKTVSYSGASFDTSTGILTVTEGGSGFSTTSADYWDITKARWATTSSDYWIGTYNKGFFFSTTSTDYWETQQAARSSGFSTTSADYWVTASTTIPKTTLAQTWNALQTFASGFLSQASSTVVGSLTVTGGVVGNASTATALAANGANASAGNAILGVDASGAAEGAFDVWTEAENTSAGYTSNTGTVTSIATTYPIQGGTITTTGTLSFPATSTLYGTGTSGQVLMWSGSTPVWAATSTGTTYTGTYPIVVTGSVISTPLASTTVAQTYGTPQIGALTFATSSDTNILLNISNTNGAFSFTPAWAGTLADARITSASTWNAKEPAISAGTINDYWRGDKTFQATSTLRLTKSQITDFGTYENPLTFNYPLTRSVDTISFPATSTLYGTGTNGQVLMWSGTTPIWAATSSVAGSGAWPFTPTTNFGVAVQSTSTPIWSTAGLQASSTSHFLNATIWGNLNVIAGQSYQYNGANIINASTTLFNYNFGKQAGNLTNTGTNNTMVGYDAGNDMAVASANTAVGSAAFNNFIGDGSDDLNNVAIGDTALGGLLYGSENTAVGATSLATATTTSANTAIGIGALEFSGYVATGNTFVGTHAGAFADPDNSTAVGYYALSGPSAISFGDQGFSITDSIALGYRAGEDMATSSNNILIGEQTMMPNATDSNMLNISNLIWATGLTDRSTPTATVSAGNVGIGTSTPGTLLSLQGVGNFHTATSTFTSTGGINLTGGCFAIGGTCVGGAADGTASSTLLGDRNTWTGLNVFSNATSTLFTSTTAWITNLFIGADTIAEYISDTIGAGVSGNTETDITVTYDDADNTFDFVVDTLPNLTGTLDYDSGGTGTSTAATLGNVLYWNGSNWEGLATSSLGITAAGDGTASSTLLSDRNTWTGLNVFSNATSTLFTATSAWITKLANLASAGFVKTSSDGTLSVDTTTYESGLTAGDGLTRTSNDFDCDTASGSVFGCLLSLDWTDLKTKISSSTIDTESELETFLTDVTNVFTNNDGALADDDLTNDSIENLSDVAAMTENYGDLLGWNGTAWADFATSSLDLNVSGLGSYDFGDWTCNGTACTLDATYLTGNQTITLSGDVSGSGATAITTTLGLEKVFGKHLSTTTNSFANGEILTFVSATDDFEGKTCAEITGSADLCDGSDATGSGAPWPFDSTTWSAAVAAGTSTNYRNTGIVAASSTFAGNATSTNHTVAGNFIATAITSALGLFGSDGLLAEYAGASCTNQFVRSLNGAGAATCATVATTDVASGITLDTEWDTESEVQTAWGSVNILLETEIDASSELAALMDDETGGTGVLVFNASPTFTGLSVIPFASSTATAVSGTGFFGTASTTNLTVSSAPNGVLVTNNTGVATASSTLGLDKIPTCASITGSAALCDGDDATGAGSAWPFTPATYYGQGVQSTTTALQLNGTPFSLFASSTALFEQASTTRLTISDGIYLAGSRITDFIADATIDLVSGALRVVDLVCTNCIDDTEITTHAGTALSADLEEEVTEGSLADSTIVSADIKDGEIVNADLSATAAIAYSKLNLVGSLLGRDLSTTTAFANGELLSYVSATDNFSSLTCAEITGSADLCDGGDATGAGGGSWPFTTTDTNFGVTPQQSTTTPEWFKGNGTWGMFASSTSVFDNATTSLFTTGTAWVNTLLRPDADDGAALGATNIGWSDLFLADSGVISWGGQADIIGNVSLTLRSDGELIFNGSDGGSGNFGAAGVKLFGADGVLTMLGLGDGADESYTTDLDNGGANVITFGTGSGATTLDWDAFTLAKFAQASTTIFSSYGPAYFGASATSSFSTAGALTLTTPLLVASGGTGAATLTGLLQGNGTSAITGITNSSTVGQILRVTGASTYAWGALNLDDTDAFTGTLPVANTQLTAGRSLTLSTDDVLADVELYTDTKCIWFEDPTADDDFKSVWANKTANAFDLSEIWAESDQTVTFMLQVDDGTPADVDSVDLAPAAGEAEDTSLNGDTQVAAGEELDLAITSVASTPTYVSICWTGAWAD